MTFPSESKLRQIGPALDFLIALLDGDGDVETHLGPRPSIAARVGRLLDSVLPDRVRAEVGVALPPLLAAEVEQQHARLAAAVTAAGEAVSGMQAALDRSMTEHRQQLADLLQVTSATVSASVSTLTAARESAAAERAQCLRDLRAAAADVHAAQAQAIESGLAAFGRQSVAVLADIHGQMSVLDERSASVLSSLTAQQGVIDSIGPTIEAATAKQEERIGLALSAHQGVIDGALSGVPDRLSAAIADQKQELNDAVAELKKRRVPDAASRTAVLTGEGDGYITPVLLKYLLDRNVRRIGGA